MVFKSKDGIGESKLISYVPLSLRHSTPIILEKIHEALQLSYGQGSMFQKAFAAKKALLAAGTVTTTSLWDFIGLGEIRSKLGGKVRIVVTTCK